MKEFEPIQWDLYFATQPKTCAKANIQMNNHLKRLLKQARARFCLGEDKDAAVWIEAQFKTIQNKFDLLGASDTEPNCQIVEQIEKYLPGSMTHRFI